MKHSFKNAFIGISTFAPPPPPLPYYYYYYYYVCAIDETAVSGQNEELLKDS